MPTAIALCKFVGTVSLGLLTGISYTLSTLSLPSLLTLPSAKPAAYTLTQTSRLASAHIRVLSTLATVSLGLAYYLSPTRVRHPYLIWTAGVGVLSGGLGFAFRKGLDAEGEEDVNGEAVEKRARQLQVREFVRLGVSGLGFGMGLVGIWGDGA